MLGLLFEVGFKSLHVHRISPLVRVIVVGAYSRDAHAFARLFFYAYPLDVLHLIVQAHIHLFVKFCESLFGLVPDHRERILIVPKQVNSLTTSMSVNVGLSSGKTISPG